MVQQEVYCDMATEDLYLRKITNVDESDNYNEAILLLHHQPIFIKKPK